MLKENNLKAPEIAKLFLSMNESGYDVKLPLSADEPLSEIKKNTFKIVWYHDPPCICRVLFGTRT